MDVLSDGEYVIGHPQEGAQPPYQRVRALTLIQEVLEGLSDQIVPQRWTEEATRLPPMGRLVVILGAAHTANYSAPMELAHVVRTFLSDGRQGA